MPNIERLTKWVEGLRSGKYPQTTQKLAALDDEGKPVGYCCLGVACEISGLGSWDSSFGDRHEGTYVVGTLRQSGTLPNAVAEWFDLFDGNPLLKVEWNADVDDDVPPEDGDYLDASATEANDDRDMTFSEIADAIERTYLIPAVSP